jgi:Copper transport outer membrane protein, MctB
VFDLRYHVASLAAVFLALVLGIVIGAAISDPGLADRAENQRLEDTVDGLRGDLAEAELRARQAEAARAHAAASYEAVVHDRLTGDHVLIVSVGARDERTAEAEIAVRDAGALVARVRAIDPPADVETITRRLEGRPALEEYAQPGRLRDLGREFGRELVEGGETPVADALEDVLVQQRSPGRDSGPVDSVVVARSVEPQEGPLAPFLTGMYEGLGERNPAVAVEVSSSPSTALRAFKRAGLSTVNAIDTAFGKVALVVLLDGGEEGDYGIGTEKVVPPIEPHEPAEPDQGE